MLSWLFVGFGCSALSLSFKSFSLPYTTIKFLFASLKLLTNFEMPTETVLRIPSL
jgi:hypothetical protein